LGRQCVIRRSTQEHRHDEPVHLPPVLIRRPMPAVRCHAARRTDGRASERPTLRRCVQRTRTIDGYRFEDFAKTE